MNDCIAGYRLREREYREYIDTWVHEIKTPITSARLILANGQGAGRAARELDRIDAFVEQALYYSKTASVQTVSYTHLKKMAAYITMRLRRRWI